jgi:O-acetyl-ADP-ribose deacetylase (regulator of RNase III)
MMFEVIKGDITKIKADAIVNAANTSLLGGSGVDGAIHRAGGKKILEECENIRNRQGGCKIGEAVVTSAGKLDAKIIIHTVGPVWNNGNYNEENLLALAYKNSLIMAIKNRVQTIAFPNISTGIYRFPKVKAAEIAINSISDFLKNHSQIEKVIFVCYDIENYNIYKTILKNKF